MCDRECGEDACMHLSDQCSYTDKMRAVPRNSLSLPHHPLAPPSLYMERLRKSLPNEVGISFHSLIPWQSKDCFLV